MMHCDQMILSEREHAGAQTAAPQSAVLFPAPESLQHQLPEDLQVSAVPCLLLSAETAVRPAGRPVQECPQTAVFLTA